MYMDYVKHVCHRIVKAVKPWPVPGNKCVGLGTCAVSNHRAQTIILHCINCMKELNVQFQRRQYLN